MPGKLSMTLRSACDGKRCSPDVTASQTFVGSSPRRINVAHIRPTHHHHHHQEIETDHNYLSTIKYNLRSSSPEDLLDNSADVSVKRLRKVVSNTITEEKRTKVDSVYQKSIYQERSGFIPSFAATDTFDQTCPHDSSDDELDLGTSRSTRSFADSINSISQTSLRKIFSIFTMPWNVVHAERSDGLNHMDYTLRDLIGRNRQTGSVSISLARSGMGNRVSNHYVSQNGSPSLQQSQFLVRHNIGLDSESDEEHLERRETAVALKQRSTLTSWFMWIWYLVYCVLSYAHLFDTWLILSIRSLFTKQKHETHSSRIMLLFLPLLLLAFLVGGSILLTDHLKPDKVASVTSTMTSDAIVHYFSSLRHGVVAFSTFIAGMWPLAALTSSLAASTERRTFESIDQSKIVNMLEKSIREDIAVEKQKLSEMKESLVEEHKHGLQLDETLFRLESRLERLENAHNLLLSDHRNCCRNSTEYATLVEQRLQRALEKAYNDNAKILNDFKEWIVSNFVTKDRFINEMSVRVPTVNARLSAEIKSEVESAISKKLEETQTSRLNQKDSTMHLSSAGGGMAEDIVKEIVNDVLMLYDADKVGMADFALESAGGSVISTRCSETYSTQTAQISIFGIPLWYSSNSPRTAIQSGVQPGECWAFKGSFGYLVIQLSARITPKAFTMEHIPRSLSPNGMLDSAPRQFSVWGLQEVSASNGILLGSYVYDDNGKPLQFFLVKDPDIGTFPIIELQIHSNYGNPDYTCLYRFRVHGVVQFVP